jgi:hypothetical protein
VNATGFALFHFDFAFAELPTTKLEGKTGLESHAARITRVFKKWNSV